MDIVNVAFSIGGLVIIFAGSLLGGFLFRLTLDFGVLNNLIIRVESLENSIKGSKSSGARKEKEERINAALAEGAVLLEAGEDPKEIIPKMIKKYPDVAMDIVKKGGLGGLKL